MERLAWVEILDRHGDVSARHPVHAWPLKVGRAYTSDIVLDDPYVAADHLEINHQDEGIYQLKIVNSINAMMIEPRHGKQADATVSANQIVRIGQTQLRIRPLNYSVSAEKPLSSNAWSRSWSALFIGVAVLLLMHFLTLWLNYDHADGYNIFLLPILGVITLLLFWVGFWALIGRVLSGRANFIAHTVNASLGVALLIFLNSLLYGYADFALDSRMVSNVLPEVIEPLIIGILLYRHFSLVSRMSRRKLGIIVVALLASLLGFGYVTDKWTADDNITAMSFSRTIGPPFLLLAHGKSTDAFISRADRLKLKADESSQIK